MSDNWEPDDLDFEEEPETPRPSLRERRARSRAEARGNLYLITGLLFGLGLGLLISLVLSPVKYLDTDPASLSPAYKDTYRRVIAVAYSADHNLDRARARVRLIDGDNSIQALAAQAQRLLGENQPPEDARALAVLASDLAKPGSNLAGTSQPLTPAGGNDKVTAAPGSPATNATVDVPVAVQTPTAPPPTPTITPLPKATFTPRPTATPVRFLSPFILKEKNEVCGDTKTAGLLEVQVNDVNGKPLGGVRISMVWQDGEDHFFTGLIPEKNPGYANFMMKPGITYSLQVGDASKPLNGLAMPGCGGGWSLLFQEGGSTN